MNEIHEKVKKSISEKCNIPLESINTGTLLADIAEDSISRVELLFEIEQMLGCTISEDEVFEIETVGDLLHIINKKIN